MLPEEMRYVAMTGPGGPEVLQVSRTSVPVPAADEVLVRVQAAGVNRPDVMQRRGLYPPPPDASPILGLEVAGEVVAMGAESTAFEVGSRVCALVNGGGYAEYCSVPATQCLPWPQGYDAVRAAALPETFFTVWANLFQHGRLVRGDSVLVHGGTSGIGVTAIQLAREFGARVFATAGSDEKCAACLALGAEAAINYRTQDFATRIAELTAGRGVDVILDIVGAAYFERNLRSLAIDGRLVEVSTQSGAIVDRLDLFDVMRRRLTVTGSTMRPRSSAEKGAIAEALRKNVWSLLDAGRVAPVIHAVYPLDRAGEAHRVLESSVHVGKLVLAVTP
ncbi:MAG TPA: NAD(P)H-quinone oxidoreductase [Steroidobacteraceae bacterium]|nr:NAD(P)H-quinone oxidoreductase [Steroidobacteraceae bacterium]